MVRNTCSQSPGPGACEGNLDCGPYHWVNAWTDLGKLKLARGTRGDNEIAVLPSDRPGSRGEIAVHDLIQPSRYLHVVDVAIDAIHEHEIGAVIGNRNIAARSADRADRRSYTGVIDGVKCACLHCKQEWRRERVHRPHAARRVSTETGDERIKPRPADQRKGCPVHFLARLNVAVDPPLRGDRAGFGQCAKTKQVNPHGESSKIL